MTERREESLRREAVCPASAGKELRSPSGVMMWWKVQVGVRPMAREEVRRDWGMESQAPRKISEK
jgi:hypothetical protein